KQQILDHTGKLPDHIIAAVGGGSNAIGMFHPFIEEKNVNMYGIEAGGLSLASGKHAATLSAGKTGVLHGTMTQLLQRDAGQIKEAFSIYAGLDYPGVGPEHSHLAASQRVTYDAITDEEALEAFQLLSQLEGIITTIESAHAISYALKLDKKIYTDETNVINISRCGDKEVQQVKVHLEGIEKGEGKNCNLF